MRSAVGFGLFGSAGTVSIDFIIGEAGTVSALVVTVLLDSGFIISIIGDASLSVPVTRLSITSSELADSLTKRNSLAGCCPLSLSVGGIWGNAVDVMSSVTCPCNKSVLTPSIRASSE